MMDILLPALLVFLSGAVFGMGTVLMVDWYYMRQWKKWKEKQDDDNVGMEN